MENLRLVRYNDIWELSKVWQVDRGTMRGLIAITKWIDVPSSGLLGNLLYHVVEAQGMFVLRLEWELKLEFEYIEIEIVMAISSKVFDS